MYEIVGFVIIGILAGFLSGLVGIGGATVIIPALVFFFSYDQKLAQGTTLLLMIPPIGILAAIEYYKAGNVNLKAGILIACFFIVGAFFGAKLANRLDSQVLRKVFALYLIIIAVKMFFQK